MKSRTLHLTLFVILALALLSSCASPTPEAPAATEPQAAATQAPAGDTLKAAVLLPGAANDQSWSQLGYEGIQSVGKELNAEVAYSENVQVADAMDALRDYARRGYNLIITHGGQYEEAVLSVADEFPDTTFVVIAGAQGGKPNVAVGNLNDYQIGYTEGYVAGKMTKSNKIGLVSHLEGMPVMIKVNGAQRVGAKAANPDAEYCIIYIKNGEDVAAAREAATSLIDSGADVVYSEMNRGWQGVADAALEAGVLTNSRDPSVADRYGESLLFGIDYGYNQLYPELARRFKEGKLGGTMFDIGYHTPGGGFTFKFTPNVPQEVVDEINTKVIPMFQEEPNLQFEDDMAASGCK